MRQRVCDPCGQYTCPHLFLIFVQDHLVHLLRSLGEQNTSVLTDFDGIRNLDGITIVVKSNDQLKVFYKLL